MSVYKRGDVWWYKFRFAGQVIRESSKSKSRTVARAAELARRRELEQSAVIFGRGRSLAPVQSGTPGSAQRRNRASKPETPDSLFR